MINIPPFLDRQYKVYSENVKSRNKLHYLMDFMSVGNSISSMNVLFV